MTLLLRTNRSSLSLKRAACGIHANHLRPPRLQASIDLQYHPTCREDPVHEFQFTLIATCKGNCYLLLVDDLA